MALRVDALPANRAVAGAEWLARGRSALSAGAWETAREAFAAAADAGGSPEALDGLGQALWWLGEVDAAITTRQRAYAGYRRRGLGGHAARVALWLSQEYAAVYGNRAAAAGWLARAEGLLRNLPPGAAHGWLALTQGRRASDPEVEEERAVAALRIAREFGDADLEIYALARIGYCRVARGRVEEGMRCFDEAMAAATGGEAESPQTIGELYCGLMVAAELSGQVERFGQWAEVVQGFIRDHGYAPLVGFCAICCAEFMGAAGQWAAAERELVAALNLLSTTGQRARCIHPAAKLADLRLRQGRLEEAEQLLADSQDLPEAALPAARLALLRGDNGAAQRRLRRRLTQLGADSLLSAPFLELLVEVQLVGGDIVVARETARRLAALGETTGNPRVIAQAALAQGRVEAARAEAAAVETLERARELFAQLGMPLEAALAAFDLARTLAGEAPDQAVTELERALAGFEKVGARREADAAAQLLRRLGGKARTGPKGYGRLSEREIEVLRLVGQGLSNAEIAERLFISVKTAGHHVSSILAKLGLRSRTEAATYAVLHLAREAAGK